MLYEAAEPESFSMNVAAAIAAAKITKKATMKKGEKRSFKIFISTNSNPINN
jgi:hypothetical protein